jgi:hypothetical protein
LSEPAVADLVEAVAAIGASRRARRARVDEDPPENGGWAALKEAAHQAGRSQTRLFAKRRSEPDVVDYDDPAYAIFPGLNAKLLREALEKDRAALVAQGYDAIWSFSDQSEGTEMK